MVTLEQIEELINHEGYEIRAWKNIDPTHQARLDTTNKIIWINTKLTQPQTIACLTHEYQHIKLGHSGHQKEPAERKVNRLTALMLITPEEYKQAELECGTHVGALAKKLCVPVWVILAWQQAYKAKNHNPL